jgi:hypothetical protein
LQGHPYSQAVSVLMQICVRRTLITRVRTGRSTCLPRCRTSFRLATLRLHPRATDSALAMTSLLSVTPMPRARAHATRTADVTITARHLGRDPAHAAVQVRQASTRCCSKRRPVTRTAWSSRSSKDVCPRQARSICRRTRSCTRAATGRYRRSASISACPFNYTRSPRVPAAALITRCTNPCRPPVLSLERFLKAPVYLVARCPRPTIRSRPIYLRHQSLVRQ